MRRLRGFLAVLLATVLLAAAAPALASNGEPPVVVVGESFTLRAGEMLESDLVIVGGDATLEEGSIVDGSVVVWGGSIEIAGEVEGDVSAFGGSVYLADTAEVEGNVAMFGGDVDRESGAQVGGQEIVGPGAAFDLWPVPRVTVPFGSTFEQGPGFFGRALLKMGQLVLLTLLMAGLGGLVAVLWPQPAMRAGEAAIQSVLPAVGVGLLTMFAALVVVVGLVVTLCLSPLGILAALVVGVATLFGWLALGIVIGERMLPAGSSPFWSAALGAGLLTLLSSLLDQVPCIGWLVPFLIACAALGAVVLTRFGTQSYPTEFSPPPPLPPEPMAVESPPLDDLTQLEPEAEEEGEEPTSEAPPDEEE
ncbi:MAG: polymer-forming cytoskeletal protein [Anaerolineae bacterium]|jgi:hypothetical protein